MLILDPDFDWEEFVRCKDLSWWCDDCEQLVPPELMAVSYQFKLRLDHVHNRFVSPGFRFPETCNHTRHVGSCKDCWEKKEHEDRDSRKWSTLKEYYDYAQSREFGDLLASAKAALEKNQWFSYKDG